MKIRWAPLALRLSLCFLLAVPSVARAAPLAASPEDLKPRGPESGGMLDVPLFRTRVTLSGSRSRSRLDKLGVTVLQEMGAVLWVLADEEQLEGLARLRFQPERTDALGTLFAAHPQATSRLVQDLGPQLLQARLDAERGETARLELSPAQAQTVSVLSSVDDDGDGLTNTQESWWTTDPMNPDSDGDGVSDGAEVTAAKDWLGNRRASYPASGRPFLSWPDALKDADFDSVPDLAERWELGLNMNRESTDRDKFDDGQELFGLTKWEWGALPRAEDTGYIFAEMPAWVEPPGDHPFVAAFPIPEIDVVESSLHVETVTVVTTDHTISEGVERSYSTAKTTGTSTSVSDTITWGNWQEVSKSSSDGEPSGQSGTGGSHSGDAAAQFGLTAAVSFLGSLGGAASFLSGPLSCLELTGEQSACGKVYDRRDEIQDSFVRAAKDVFVEDIYDPDADALQNLGKVARFVALAPLMGAPYAGELLQKAWVNNHEYVKAHADQQKDQQNAAGMSNSIQIVNENSNEVNVSPTIRVEVPVAHPPTQTSTKGKSWGGSQSTTHSQYEEQTITNGEAFSDEESWGDATAVDSAHAADLWFSYRVANGGTEYAREINDLAFNVYIGDESNPACTYFVGPDLGGDGAFHNFVPGETHAYTSRRLPLTLGQMRLVDLGGPVRVVVEDFSYGDDEYFYQEAMDSGMVVAIEDGTQDGSEELNVYLLPTWGDESIQDVMARYFPILVDDDGKLDAAWTPEFLGTVPLWCGEARMTGDTVWCRHGHSNAGWWSVYLSEAASEGVELRDIPASPGSAVLVRFNRDSDFDGYNDRSELALGTDASDPDSHPRPELVAATACARTGDDVTCSLSLLNQGNYDAYGIQAVMFAPTDAVSVTNNIVGGSGRVPAGGAVVVGSEILPAHYSDSTWHGIALPVSGGYYEGDLDKVYTFAAQNSGDVGNATLSFAWHDGWYDSGTISAGAGYLSPLPIDVQEGLQVGFLSGSVQAGDEFTVTVRTPRDTFQYTIHEEPYTEPLVIVSYNDPQGNHRFITPVTITHPTDDLAPYQSEMLDDAGIELVTSGAYAIGANTTDVVANNRAPVDITDSHLFLDFVDEEGMLALEVGVAVTVPAGPSVVPVDWDTAAFSPTFDTHQEYIVLAFWTDYEGNIIDSVGRPLSSFQQDPRPVFEADDGGGAWDLGSMYQGQTVYRTLTTANTGQQDLILGGAVPQVFTPTVGLAGNLYPGDTSSGGYLADTSVPGSVDENWIIRSSDYLNPELSILISATVHPLPDLTLGLDDIAFDEPYPTPGETVAVSATVHNQGTGPAFDVAVHFYEGDPRVGGAQLGSEQVITHIPSGGSGVAQTSFSYAEGHNTVFVQGDPLDVIPEEYEFDNLSPGFLHVSAALPPDGLLGGQSVVVLSSAEGLTTTTAVTITDQATLVMRGISTTISSMTLDGSSALVLDNASLKLTSLASRDTSSPRYMRIISSTLASSSAVSVSVGTFDAYSTTLSVVGADGRNGTWPHLGSTNGSPGQPASLHLMSMHGLSVIDSALLVRGGRGGSGFGYGADWIGNGAAGGCAVASVDSTVSIMVRDTAIQVIGGGGGSGGSWEGNGGSAGIAGVAVLDVDAPEAQVQESELTAMGGRGGNGGTCTSGGGWGATGKPGAESRLGVTAATLIVSESMLASQGGDGGNGGGADDWTGGAGGLGGVGGQAITSTTASFVTSTLSAAGGHGGAGGSSYNPFAGHCTGGHGGDGGPALQDVTSSVLHGAGVVGTIVGGAGGDGGDGGPYEDRDGGDGGDGGNCTQAWLSEGVCEVSFHQLASRPGSGGRGGNPSNAGVPGLDGNAGHVDQSLTDGYASHKPTGSGLTLPQLEPNLLSLTGVVTVSLAWDSAASTTVESPYLTQVPSTIGFHGLHAWYTLTDTTTVSSTHGVYAYRQGAADYDGDGISDYSEVTVTGTDPVLADTDDDGLDDNEETCSDPLNADSDYDGTPDGMDPQALGCPDVTPWQASLAFTDPTPTDGDTISATLTISNTGASGSGGLTAALYAEHPDWGEMYVGSEFLTNVAANGAVAAEIPWDTLGFTGTVAVRVVVDPYDRVPETNELNNQATSSLTIDTRPDLRFTSLALSDDEPVAGETVTVTMEAHNDGQAAAGSAVMALYEGNPDDGGTELATQALALSSGGQEDVAFTWTAGIPGPYRLFALSDRDDDVWEYDEGNNQTWRDVYVGFAGPLYLDCGEASDVPYSTTVGYGHVDVGQVDQVVDCGAEPHQTLRQDVDGAVWYQFDHLLPGHFYHLDLSLYECDHAGRQESVYVDGQPVAGPVYLGDGEKHPLSWFVDPAFYGDRTISVTVGDPGLDGAVVGEIALHDIDYWYADAGADGDLAYGAERGYGYLDGTEAAGVLPYQSARVDRADNELRYQFDGLDPAKSYQVNLTFWQGSGEMRRQKVQIDGQTDPLDVGTLVDVEPGVLYELVVPVMASYYAADGSIVVSIVRTNADTGAMVSEIAVEEVTLTVASPCEVPETPDFTEAYGGVTLNGLPAPTDTLVETVSPRGDVVGCFVVQSTGQYGLMRIYGADDTATPPIPGMEDGEAVSFRVNGALAVATPLLYWEDDWASHHIDLGASTLTSQAIWLASGWNLMSMNVEPPVPLVEQALDSIDGDYDRVLGEYGIWDASLGVTYTTLSELDPGLGYYLRVTGIGGVNLLLEGVRQAVTTPLALHEGWNWIGYLPDAVLPVTEALQSIDGQYLRVLSLDLAYDVALPGYQTLYDMRPGEGYLIRTTDAVTLTYPEGEGSALSFEHVARADPCAGTPHTPWFTLVYGELMINERPAPPGTCVDVVTRRGDVAGCFVVQQAGHYGLVHVYGEDATAQPVIAGFRDDEPLRFRVNGVAVDEPAPLSWHDDKEPHQVALSLDLAELYLPLILRGGTP